MKKIVLIMLLMGIYCCVYGEFFLFEPQVVDARSHALGRTTALSVNGSNALFYNPACLVDADKLVFQTGMRFNGRKMDYDYESEDREDESFTYKLRSKLNHISIAYPVNIESISFNPVLAIGYRNYYDYATKCEYEFNDSPALYEQSGGFNTLSLGVGWKLVEMLSVGASVNIGILGKVKYNNSFYYDDELYEYESESELSGNFVQFGVRYEISPYVSTGFYYRTGFVLEEDLDDVGFYSKEKYAIPAIYAFSLEYLITEELTLFLEYQNRALSDYEEAYIGEEDDEEEFREMYGFLKDGYSFRMGAEINDRFRLGFYMDSIPFFDIDDDGEPDETPKTNMGFTSGAGFNLFDRLTLDIYGGYSFFSVYYEDGYDMEQIRSIYEFGFGLRYDLN